MSGHKVVWAQMGLGTKCVRAQTCLSTNVSGRKRLGTYVSGHKRVWAQTCQGTNVSGHEHAWAEASLGTISGPKLKVTILDKIFFK